MVIHAIRLGTLAMAGLALVVSVSALLAVEPATKETLAMPKVGAMAADFELMNAAGKEVSLDSLTKAGPVVVVVLRGYPGYQCPACTAQVADVLANAKQFEAAEANVVFIYPGQKKDLEKHAMEFSKGMKFPMGFQLLLDPEFQFTNAYHLRWDAENETAYPATFVVSPEKKILYAKISQTHGNRAPAAEVLKALAKK